MRNIERGKAIADHMHCALFLLRKLRMHVDVAAQSDNFIINPVDRGADSVGVHFALPPEI